MKSPHEVALRLINESEHDSPEQTHEKLTRHYKSAEGSKPFSGGFTHKTQNRPGHHLKKMGFGAGKGNPMTDNGREYRHPNGTRVWMHTYGKDMGGESHTSWHHHEKNIGSESLPEVKREFDSRMAEHRAYRKRMGYDE